MSRRIDSFRNGNFESELLETVGIFKFLLSLTVPTAKPSPQMYMKPISKIVEDNFISNDILIDNTILNDQLIQKRKSPYYAIVSPAVNKRKQ